MYLRGLAVALSLFAAVPASAQPPTVDSWNLVPANPAPGASVTLHVAGDRWPMCPIVSHDLTWSTSEQAVVLLHPWPKGCGGSVDPWQRDIDLGPLSSGNYRIDLRSYGYGGTTVDNPFIVGVVEFSIGGAVQVPSLSGGSLLLFAALLSCAALVHVRRRPAA